MRALPLIIAALFGAGSGLCQKYSVALFRLIPSNW